MYEYEKMRRVTYEGGACFVPVCVVCGRFIRRDKTIKTNEITGLSKEPNCTCSKCGRSHMVFEGFM